MGISLDDLKNDGNEKKPDSEQKQHTPFVPGIIGEDNSESNIKPDHKPFIPGIVAVGDATLKNDTTEEDDPIQNSPKSKMISMIARPKQIKKEEDEDSEERESVDFKTSTIGKSLHEKYESEHAEELSEEAKHNSILNVGSLLADGVDNPLIKSYQERKRAQMNEFFQAQKLEKELTGHSDFDTDGLEMKFGDDVEVEDNKVFRHIDLGAGDGNVKGTNRSNKGDTVLPKTEKTVSETSENAESGSRDRQSSRDDGSGRSGSGMATGRSDDSRYIRSDTDGRNESGISRGHNSTDTDDFGDEPGDDIGRDSESDTSINNRELGSGNNSNSGEYDNRSAAGSYQRGSVREENNIVENREEITATENAQPVDTVVEEKVEEVQTNPEPVDSVDFTEEDTYTHEKGIESIKAGEAAKKEAIEAKEKAEKEKTSGVTVDMEINRKVAEFKSSDGKILDDDEMEIEDKNDDDDDLEDEKERRVIIRNIISEKIKPVAKKMNLQGYTVAKKGTTSNNIFKSKEVPVAHWVLYNTGVAIDIQEIRGIDIERMEEASRSQFRQREMFQIIYDNVVSPKPETLDTWLKSISFNDLDNLMMAIHIAAFADSNYIPIDCESKKCPKKYFLTDNIPIMNMVEFKDESVKDKFMNMYNNPTYNKDGWYTTEIIPISEDFAIGFKEPNLYNMVIEIGYGEQDFKEKYQRTIAAVPFIDQIYQIDKTEEKLVPIEWKEFVNNPVKTYKSKILRYDKIISRFTSDELSALEGIVAEINNRDEFITYKRPEVVCPYCGEVKKEAKPISMAQTVFSRNQLAALAVSLEN